MAKLVCADCNEVLEEDFDGSIDDADTDGHSVTDQRQNRPPEEDDEPEESDEGAEPDADDGLDESDELNDIEDRLSEKFDEKVDELEDDDSAEDVADDAAQYETVDDLDLEVIVGQDSDPLDVERWSELKSDGKRISSTFQDKLRQKQRDSTKRGQTSGRFDSRSMIDADRGSSRVFKRDDPGKKLNYGAWFILDRSSSMTNGMGDRMKAAEDALTTLGFGLEEAGVETEVLDFIYGDPRVVKTRSQSLKDEAHNILTGHTGGGTPLGEVMEMTTERVNSESGQPFVAVITDGQPNDEDRFIEAVDECQVPVIAVTIGRGGMSSDQKERYFDAYIDVMATEDIAGKLEELARKVMF